MSIGVHLLLGVQSSSVGSDGHLFNQSQTGEEVSLGLLEVGDELGLEIDGLVSGGGVEIGQGVGLLFLFGDQNVEGGGSLGLNGQSDFLVSLDLGLQKDDLGSLLVGHVGLLVQ